MQGDQGEDECFQILNQVVEDTQPFWVSRLGHVDERANFRSLLQGEFISVTMVNDKGVAWHYLERDVLISQSDFQLLSAILVLLWPLGIVFPTMDQ